MKRNYKTNKKKELSNKRTRLVLYFFLSCFVVIFFRAFWLQISPPSLKEKSYVARRSYLKRSKNVSYRGTIYDHKKRPLAISIKTPSIYVNPQIFNPNKKQRQALSKTLGISQKHIKSVQQKKKYFAWLKRKASPQEAKAVKALRIGGVSQTIEPARFYPGRSYAAQLLGLVGTDNMGLFGLEKLLDEELAGATKKVTRLKDARG